MSLVAKQEEHTHVNEIKWVVWKMAFTLGLWSSDYFKIHDKMRWHIAFTNLPEQKLPGKNIENELHFSAISRRPIHGKFSVTLKGGGGEGKRRVSTRDLSSHASTIFSRILAYPNWYIILKFQINDSSGLFKQFAGLYFLCSSYSGTSRFSFKRWT